MRISILTHPLGANYGGILQAFALSKYLHNQGHEVFVLNRNADMPFLKRVIKAVMVKLRHPRYNNPRYNHLVRFVKQHIHYSKPLYTTAQMTDFVQRNKIQVCIVGSDQVWRADFAMNYGYDYFLGFVPKGAKKLAYAASFGISEWNYNLEQTRKIICLLHDFVAISVREENGVKLCLEHTGIEAEHVLDPTMLLRAEDYDSITNPRIEPDDYVFVYWLGTADEKQKAIDTAVIDGKKIIDISLRGRGTLMPIEDWLSYIKYAEYVITDSFHGCVFSILFQKQFTIFSNNSGGNGRLKSLFNMLHINPNEKTINYSLVGVRLNELRNKSCSFLLQSLQK